MVIECSFVSLNFHIASSYQPKNQKIQDGRRRNVLCYCIEDIHMVRKHSFVYLHIYNVTPLPTCHKIWVVIPNVHNLMWEKGRVIIDI